MKTMHIIKSQQSVRSTQQAAPRSPRAGTKRQWTLLLLTAAASVILIIAGLRALGIFAPQRIDGSKYQVVYLTNGQAYFGKLQNTTGDYLYVMMPYTAQSVTPNTAGGNENSGTETTTTLLRVKDQVYGPEDSIAIRASQVAFWQNLRDDSKVAQAIKAKQ
jgi:hypothetical protein